MSAKCTVQLIPPDRDLHRIVWRRTSDEPLQDYRMTRITFGVSASSFAANMFLKQNALDFAVDYPHATKAVEASFYVDDGLTGADSVQDAIELHQQLQNLFTKGGFLLRKWNSSESAVLKHIPTDLKDTNSTQQLPDTDQYTKTLGTEWNASQDHFRLTVAELPPITNLTKRALVLDIAKTLTSLDAFLPQSLKSKCFFNKSGNKRLIGMILYHLSSSMPGYNGALSYTCSRRNTFLGATLTRSLISLPHNSMASVMHLNRPMLWLCTSE